MDVSFRAEYFGVYTSALKLGIIIQIQCTAEVKAIFIMGIRAVQNLSFDFSR